MRIQTRHLHTCSVQRIVEYVLCHESGQIDLPEMADAAGLSQSHLVRVFSSQIGESPADFSRRVRLERAAHRLVYTKTDVQFIAHEAGYANHPAFTRAFTNAFGSSPIDFRNSEGADWHLSSPTNLHWLPSKTADAYVPVDSQEVGPEQEIIALPECQVGLLRVTGGYQAIPDHWKKLSTMTGTRFPEGTQFLTIYHDSIDRRPPEKHRADLCIVQPNNMVGVGLRKGKLPGGIFVRTKQFTSGSQANDAWCWMARHWIPNSGSRPDNVPAFEETLTFPGTVADRSIRIYIGLEMDLGYSLDDDFSNDIKRDNK